MAKTSSGNGNAADAAVATVSPQWDPGNSLVEDAQQNVASAKAAVERATADLAAANDALEQAAAELKEAELNETEAASSGVDE
jgi:hypothetical protein